VVRCSTGFLYGDSVYEVSELRRPAFELTHWRPGETRSARSLASPREFRAAAAHVDAADTASRTRAGSPRDRGVGLSPFSRAVNRFGDIVLPPVVPPDSSRDGSDATRYPAHPPQALDPR